MGRINFVIDTSISGGADHLWELMSGHNRILIWHNGNVSKLINIIIWLLENITSFKSLHLNSLTFATKTTNAYKSNDSSKFVTIHYSQCSDSSWDTKCPFGESFGPTTKFLYCI